MINYPYEYGRVTFTLRIIKELLTEAEKPTKYTCKRILEIINEDLERREELHKEAYDEPTN